MAVADAVVVGSNYFASAAVISVHRDAGQDQAIDAGPPRIHDEVRARCRNAEGQVRVDFETARRLFAIPSCAGSSGHDPDKGTGFRMIA
jgi:uncharacterized protein (UPF0262 family)